MNYRKLKPEKKLRYVDTHSGVAKERLETAMQHGEAGATFPVKFGFADFNGN